MPNLILTFHLISEMNKTNSFWAPYIKTLPNNYSTILYMTQEDLVQLKGSSLLDEVVKIKRNVARQYAYFWMKISNEHIKFFGNFTYDIYRYFIFSLSPLHFFRFSIFSFFLGSKSRGKKHTF